MKKLLDQVNNDIQSNNLGTAIQRVRKFLKFKALILKERSQRKAEWQRIETLYSEYSILQGAAKYEAQPNVVAQVQGIADRISVHKIWPAIVSFLGLLATIFGIIQFLAPGPNLCPEIDKSKCSLIISNFSSADGQGKFIADQIFMGVNRNPIFSELVSLGLAENEPYNNSGDVGARKCIEDCKSDFSIYGSYFAGSQDLSFFIMDKDGKHISGNDEFVYNVSEEGLRNLDNETAASGEGANVVIYSICSACELEKSNPEIYSEMAAATNSPVSKQSVFKEAHLYWMKNNDLEKAKNALDKIEQVTDNKYAVFALEKSSSLAMEMGEYFDAFTRQSRYIEKVGTRLENPAKYQVTNQTRAYSTALLKMRENRGLNGYRNLDKMNLSKEQNLFVIKTSIEDLETVGPSKYRLEIKALKDRLKNISEIPQPDIKIGKLQVRINDQNTGASITDARVRLNSRTLSYINNAYRMEAAENEIIGKELTIEKTGFQSITRRVGSAELSSGIQVNLTPVVKPPIFVELEIEPYDAETKSIIPGAIATLNQRTYQQDQTKGFFIEGNVEDLLNQTVVIQADGYEDKKFLIERKNLNKRTRTSLTRISTESKTIEYHIQGSITFCRGINPNLQSIQIGDQKVEISKKMTFSAVLHMQPDSRVQMDLGPNYDFVDSRQSIISLGSDPDIKFRLPVMIKNFEPTEVVITGVALLDGKPMKGAYLKVVDQDVRGMRLGENGEFKVAIPWNKQCESFKLSAGSEGWNYNESAAIQFASFYKGENRINLGRVPFKFISIQID